MTIANTNVKSTYNCNGVTREWDLGFYYDSTLSSFSISVTHSDGTSETVTANYELDGNVLTYPTVESELDPLPEGDTITISRITPLTQSINLVQQGPLDAETLESGYDKLTMEVQEVKQATTDNIQNINIVAENISSVNAVASNETNINAVNANKTNIDTVATNINDISTVSSDSSSINAVANDLENIDAVANDLTNVDTVAGVASDLPTIVANLSDINTVVENIQDVSTVADISSDVTTVANNSTNITAVSENATNINTVASNSTNINSVASDLTNIDTAATNIAAIIAAPTAATNAANSAAEAQIWAEGTDGQVSPLGGEHSAKGWANRAQEIAESIGAIYKPAGSIAFASLPALSADVLGNVYNITDAFTTTADFVEGAGNNYPAGTNVAIVDVGTGGSHSYKFDVLSGFVDLSAYRTAAAQDVIDSGKQDTLVSGTNIKTVNSNSLLGSGNIDIDALPSQTGQSGKFLTTNGSAASWADIPTEVDNKSITLNSSDQIQTVGVIDQNNTSNAIKTWTGTKVQYDAILSKDANTLYTVTDEIDEPPSASSLGVGFDPEKKQVLQNVYGILTWIDLETPVLSHYTFDGNGNLTDCDDKVFLRSSGSQRIDTGITVSDNNTLDIKFKLFLGDFCTLCGIYNTNTSAQYSTNSVVYASNYSDTRILKTNGRIAISPGSGDHHLVVSSTTVTLDDSVLSWSSDSGNNATGNLNIFAGKFASAISYGRLSINRFKIYDSSNNLLRDFVPVKEGMEIGGNTLMANGLWDIVNQTFYGNLGSGTFDFHVEE